MFQFAHLRRARVHEKDATDQIPTTVTSGKKKQVTGDKTQLASDCSSNRNAGPAQHAHLRQKEILIYTSNTFQ